MIGQLRNGSRTVAPIGRHGVRVLRPGRPDAVGYCVVPDPENPFAADDLDDAIGEVPDVGMVIVTRRLVDPDVYDRARAHSVCVDTFGGFVSALSGCEDVATYIHREEIYLRDRLAATRAVTATIKCGHRAWRIARTGGLRPLVIAAHDRYELTDDGFGDVLRQYPKLALDALVVTNPNAQGFGDRVVRSAGRAGVPLFTLNDFLDAIREPWT